LVILIGSPLHEQLAFQPIQPPLKDRRFDIFRDGARVFQSLFHIGAFLLLDRIQFISQSDSEEKTKSKIHNHKRFAKRVFYLLV
jgi:hypothetical protein